MSEKYTALGKMPVSRAQLRGKGNKTRYLKSLVPVIRLGWGTAEQPKGGAVLTGSTAKRPRLVSVAHTEPSRDRLEEHNYYYHLQQPASKKESFRIKAREASDKAAESFRSLHKTGQRAEQQLGQDAEIDHAHVWRTV